MIFQGKELSLARLCRQAKAGQAPTTAVSLGYRAMIDPLLRSLDRLLVFGTRRLACVVDDRLESRDLIEWS
jgi:hypothetical protein